jgi:hypothetical protein
MQLICTIKAADFHHIAADFRQSIMLSSPPRFSTQRGKAGTKAGQPTIIEMKWQVFI